MSIFGREYKDQTLTKSLLIFFGLLLGYFFPAGVLYYVMGRQIPRTSWDQYGMWWILVLPLCMIFLTFWRMRNYEHSRRWGNFKRELVFIFFHGRYACVLAAGFGLMAVTTHLMLPYNGNVGVNGIDRMASAFPIYVGVVGTILGVHALYRKSSPILEIEDLLEYLALDLEVYNKKVGNKLLVVFPALNIGHYRLVQSQGQDFEGTPLVSSGENPYWRYRSGLLGWNQEALVVTHDSKFYKNLFRAYCSEVAPAEVCASEARSLVKFFEEGGKSKYAGTLPAQVIVVGPVCYTLSAYGLPKFKDGDYEIGGAGLVEIVAYRREDSMMADLIWSEVQQELAEPEKVNSVAAKP